ncbi:MAG: TetR family transcriptional regulator [Dehalococcoidia bacterium]
MTNLRMDYLAARRNSIREAAERVFLRRGFDGATMLEIAGEAGVSAGSIYRYFDSKHDLIQAVAQACGDRYAAQFTTARSGAASPLDVLITAGTRIWDGLRVEGARDDAILNLEATLVAAREPEVAAPLAESIREMVRLLEGLISDAQERGELDRSVEPAALAMLLIAVTGGIQTLAIQLGEAVDIAATWRVLEQLLAGIRSREDGA